MRFNSTPEPDTPVPLPAPVAAPPRRASPLAKAIRAVPDATLQFLLDAPADFDANRIRKEFLYWAIEHGRMNDTDWRPAWSAFVQSYQEKPPAAAAGFKITTTRDTLPPVGPVRPIHPWAARLSRRLAA